jgi:hypothetical protein
MFNVRFMLVYCLAYSSTLKVEATCFYGTSVGSRRYTPEDRTLQNMKGGSAMYTLKTLLILTSSFSSPEGKAVGA